jgi:hypothetical protein
VAILVDIRPEGQRAIEGGIAGALVVERNVLEWRFDPASSARLPVDEVGVPLQYLADLSGNGPVARKIRGQEYRVRTETFGANRGHGGTHAELSGLVRSSANHRTVPAPGHEDRLAAQLGIVPLLNGRIKRIHVDMNDLTHGRLVTILFRS